MKLNSKAEFILVTLFTFLWQGACFGGLYFFPEFCFPFAIGSTLVGGIIIDYKKHDPWSFALGSIAIFNYLALTIYLLYSYTMKNKYDDNNQWYMAMTIVFLFLYFMIRICIIGNRDRIIEDDDEHRYDDCVIYRSL